MFPLIAALLLSAGAQIAWAATPQQQLRAKTTSIEGLVKKAGRQYTAKKYDEAGESIGEAQKLLLELEAEGDSKAAPLPALRKSIIKARGLLETAGAKLPPLAEPAAAAAKGAAPGGKISFVKQVSPILVAKCGRCHIDKASGDFSMATFTQLQRGSKDGAVFLPGKGKTSRMIELIEQGDMPRGGGTLPPEELALLTKWIDEGALFDGPDQAARLSGAGTPKDAEPPLPVVQASGKEQVLFARDIAPVLLANCIGCHGDLQPRARFSVDTFALLLRGGESGAVIAPGNAGESMIVKKLRGTGGGNRMPNGQPPLAEEVIAKFEKWIAEGAKFDGIDPNEATEMVVAVLRAQTATHEELSRDRVQMAAKKWHLVLPDAAPDQVETEHFLLIGNIGAKELEEVGRVAEEQVPKIEKSLKTSFRAPFIKGRLTIYVFQKHYDYGEVGTMLENREIPTESHGHWRYNIVDAYACVVPPKHGEYSLAALLTQQIGSGYVAAQATVPKWFAEGSGRALAARIYPKDPLVRRWDEQIMPTLSGSTKPDEFQTPGMNPAEAGVLSYSFVKSLMASAPRYNAMLAAVRSGAPFEQAFAKTFGHTPSELASGWAAHVGSKRGR